MTKITKLKLSALSEQEKKEYEKIRGLLLVAEEIYRARTQLSLSQAELASLVGTTQRIISNIENAEVNIGFDLLLRISNALGLNFKFGTKGIIECGASIMIDFPRVNDINRSLSVEINNNIT